jgi:hypothetical protein
METSSNVAELLRQTKPWVRFLSVLGFIGVGLMCLAGAFGAAAAVVTGDPNMVAVSLIYPVAALLYLFPSLFLFRYASRIADFLRGGQAAQLEAALAAQKSFWKFVGILTVVMLVLYVGILAVALGLAIIGAAAV